MKDNLLSSFSHELRTPLNSNMLLLEEACDSMLVSDEVKNEYLKPALSSSKLLLSLINDVIDYSQLLT